MRKKLITPLAIAASLGVATSAAALEKTAARMGEDSRPADWNAGTTCSVAYYNTCTGWVWVWSGFAPNEVYGVCFESCCVPGGGTLMTNWSYVWTAAPAGYGFTGTIAVSNADANCCPTAPALASQTFFPISGWNMYSWGVNVGPSFVVAATLGPGAASPIALASDHAAAGPTGPVACGTCYASPRPAHSFSYGTSGGPCVASSLNDGTCACELLWDAQLSCTVSVEDSSWGTIKNLYR